jgi:hypothetical protein
VPGQHTREEREPEEDCAGADRAQRGGERAAAAHDPGQHELQAPGLLLGAQRPNAAEQSPERGEDRDRAEPPRQPAAGRQQLVRHPVEQARALVRAEAARELDAVGERRVRAAIADGLGHRREREQRRE